MEMITALIKANKQFDLFIYLTKITEFMGETQDIIYIKMTDFYR